MNSYIKIKTQGFVSVNDISIATGCDTVRIQKAVDVGAEFGLRVVIPPYNIRSGDNTWTIERAIKLHSGSTVIIDNCILRQADGMFENIFRNSAKGTDAGYTKEGRQYDITITGIGNATLDGGQHNGLREANSLKDGYPHVTENSPINLLNVGRINISNLRIVNQRYWGMTFHYCSCAKISDIDFLGIGENTNMDGIDLRTGCSDFVIENITGYTEDDTVALTCLRSIYDDKMVGFDNSIHGVIIRNICVSSPRGLIRILNHYNKKIYGVVIENIFETLTDSNSITPGWRLGSCVRIGENHYYRDGAKAALGDTHNITVRNVFGRMRMGVRVSCTLSDSTFENINVLNDGGTAVYFGEGVYRRINVKSINYAPDNAPNIYDDNRSEGNFNKTVNKDVPPNRIVCAVYFKDADAKQINFSSINAGKNLSAVFGGSGNVEGTAENIVKQCEHLPTTADGLNIKLTSK